jgi:hypothetical protein
MPTVKDYTAYADVTGVNNLVEVSLKIAAATQADSDTRSEIQTLVNDAPGLAAAKKSTLEASSYGVNTNDTTTSTITMQAKDANGNNLPLKLIVFEVNVKLTSTALPTSEPSKAALTLTVSTVLLVIVVSFTFTSKTINFKGSIYKTMKSPSTGRIWLDRNLGAKQSCIICINTV